MINKSIIIVFSIFLLACAEKKEVSVPENILPIEKMADVLLDVHLLEASLNITVFDTNTPPQTDNTAKSFDVFKKNKTDKQQFDESLKFYTHKPEMLNKIYDLVLNNLSKMQAEVGNKK